MKRDKIISVRVNSELLKRFEDLVKSHTERVEGDRPFYRFHDPKKEWIDYGKYTVADLLERSLEDYCDTFEPGKK